MYNSPFFFVTFNFVKFQIIGSHIKCSTHVDYSYGWSHYGSHEMQCKNVYLFQVSYASLNTCPFLNSETIFIPANVQRELVVKAAQLPKPKVVN